MLRLAKRGRELPLKLKQALDKKKVEWIDFNYLR
jgi:hypothetical protein